MRNFLEILDGSGKSPRKEQAEYLTHLQKIWESNRIFGLAAPPGVGKSYIARTIQRTLPFTTIITTNNQLVDQYTSDYLDLNGVKGKDYYENEESYRKSRENALYMDNVFNPLSYYYFYLRHPEMPRPTTVVIDEAHKLADMLLLTVGKSLSLRQYGIPRNLTDKGFLDWLTAQCTKLSRFHGDESNGNRKTLSSQFETLKILQQFMERNLAYVQTLYEDKDTYKGTKEAHITVRPLKFPADLLNVIFGETTRIVLMSGTLTKPHLEELFPNDNKIDLVHFKHPAKRESRLIYHAPIPHERRRDPGAIADAIRAAFLDAGRPNTLVHTTYDMSTKLAHLLKDLRPLTNTKEDKGTVIEQFKSRGGLLIGAGMAEGIDLPGDYCRLIIIPLLLYPNRADSAVIKRLALPKGPFWYGLEALCTLIQQVGRGVRGADDACKTIVLDITFKRLVQEYDAILTADFKSTIIW